MRIGTQMWQTVGAVTLGILTVSLMAMQYLLSSTTYLPPRADSSPLSADISIENLSYLSEPKDAYEIFRLHFTGGVVIGSMLGTQTHGTFNAAVLETGTEPWLSDCTERFANDTMTFSLLDTVLTDNAALPTRQKLERVWYLAPTYHAKILTNGGIDTVSLATPHSLDYGTDGLSDTISALEKYGIDWGDGTHAVYRTQNGVTLGVYPTSVRLTSPDEAYAVPYDAAVLSWLDRTREKCDFVSIYLTIDDAHPVSVEELLSFAELCAERGADLVLLDMEPDGDPVMQILGKSRIVYGLGTFLSGGERLTDRRHMALEVEIRTESGTLLSWDASFLSFSADAEEPWILHAPDPFDVK